MVQNLMIINRKKIEKKIKSGLLTIDNFLKVPNLWTFGRETTLHSYKNLGKSFVLPITILLNERCLYQ